MLNASRFTAAVISTTGAMLGMPAFAQVQYADQTTTRFPQPNLLEYTNQASVCDLDNDGDLDIVWANGQGFSSQGVALKLRVFINDGTGIYTDESDLRVGAGTPPVAFSGWSRGVEFGDCDNDGDWDMIVAQDFNKRPQLFINGLGGPSGDQLGYFKNETTTRLPNITMSSARSQFGDVDNDGDLDLIFCHAGATSRFGTGQPQIFLNNGAGVYSNATATNFPAQLVTDQQDILFADVDNDFDLDVHVGTRSGTSKLWINNGAGVYSNLTPFPGGSNAYSYDFGDMDGDGDLDIFGAQGGAEILLKNNNPSTAWINATAELSPNTGIDDNDSKWYDYDNDGDNDIIIGSLGATERLYRNNGSLAGADFTLISGVLPAIQNATLDIKVADFNNDGKYDYITAQGESGSFIDRIYINIGPDTLIDNIPPVITTEQIATEGTAGPFIVRARALDAHSSDRGFHDKGVTLFYYLNDEKPISVPMKWVGNSMWRGEIPAQTRSGTLSYFVTAVDWVDNVGESDTKTIDIGIVPCPADVDNTGAVDVDDLLVVINNWGSAGGPGDINGSGSVDTDDLLAVINGWGPCQ